MHAHARARRARPYCQASVSGPSQANISRAFQQTVPNQELSEGGTLKKQLIPQRKCTKSDVCTRRSFWSCKRGESQEHECLSRHGFSKPMIVMTAHPQPHISIEGWGTLTPLLVAAGWAGGSSNNSEGRSLPTHPDLSPCHMHDPSSCVEKNRNVVQALKLMLTLA